MILFHEFSDTNFYIITRETGNYCQAISDCVVICHYYIGVRTVHPHDLHRLIATVSFRRQSSPYQILTNLAAEMLLYLLLLKLNLVQSRVKPRKRVHLF